VSNNIDYIPYYGSYKGSQYTLLERSGNDWDTCSLLMALYRVSGIPCRYRRGIIRMQGDTVKNWIGVQDIDTAWSIFWESYVPVGPIWEDTASTKLSGLLFEHVFVEACLPYGNYRGIMNDLSEQMWIPLDPSFKSYDYTEGNGQAKEVSFDSQSYLAGTTTLSPIQYFKQQLQNQGISVEQAKRTRKIRQQKFEVLPSALPYYGQDDPYYKLDSYVSPPLSRLTINDRVRIELSTDRTSMFQQITDVPSLYGKRLAITYKGYQQEDERLIDEGKIHLAKLAPELRADGVPIASGWFGLNIGETEELKLFLIPPHPGYSKEGIGYPNDVGESRYLGYPYILYTGAVHNLALDTAGDTSGLIKSRVDRFISTIENSSSEDINIMSEEIMGELLCIAALRYLQNTETELNELASLKDYSINRR
ncbi:MAG: transglutaminase-like domain-containing protein, partial [Candidatus Desantisbacteria bacterium]